MMYQRESKKSQCLEKERLLTGLAQPGRVKIELLIN
jgi:hypothetical protein